MKPLPGTTATAKASSKYVAKSLSVSISLASGVRLPITPLQEGKT